MFSSIGRMVAKYWRGFLARLPLPLLGLAAMYGVYRFALIFSPPWVAVVMAGSFEFVYIGLAVYDKFDERQRRSAVHVSWGAVVTSILYNVLDGYFHRRPWLLDSMPWWGDLLLAIVHGAPLAILAFLVSRLVMHPATPSENRPQSPKPVVGGRTPEYSLDDLRGFLDGVENFKRSDVVEALGCSPSTASELLKLALADGLVDRNNGGYVVL